MTDMREVKFAEEEILRLQLEKGRKSEERKILAEDIQKQFKDIISNYLIEDAQILNDGTFYATNSSGIEYRVIVGFKDLKRPYGVFGADFDIYYDNNELKINAGTIGEISRNENPFNVKRVFVEANIWKHVEEIEKQIKEIDTSEYLKISEEYNSLNDAIATCQRTINKAIAEKLVNDLKVGDCYIYSNTHYDLKGNWLSNENITVTIKSITEDNITITQRSTNKRINKNTFIGFLKENKLIKVNNL